VINGEEILTHFINKINYILPPTVLHSSRLLRSLVSCAHRRRHQMQKFIARIFLKDESKMGTHDLRACVCARACVPVRLCVRESALTGRAGWSRMWGLQC
jgi:hypothetical protein